MHAVGLALEPVARAAAALLTAAGFLHIAYVGGFCCCPSRGVLTRWVATIAVLLWVPTALFHLLALPRLFSPIPALLAIGVLSGLASRVGGSERRRRFLARDLTFVRRVARLVRRSPHRGMIVAFFVCAAPGLLRAFILPLMGWDTLTYHALKAGMWVQNGGVDSMVGTGPWGYYQNIPAGGEVFTAWAMLPLRSDALAPAVEVGQWLTLGFVLLVLARRLSLREPYSSVGVGFFLAVPTVKLMVGSGYVELVLLLCAFTGLTLGLDAWRKPADGALALSLGSLGISAATKVSMIPVAMVTAAVLLAGSLKTGRWRVPALGMLAFAIALSPWMFRTTARTGLPLSPLPVQVAGLTLGAASPEVQWYMERPELRPYELDTEWNVIKRLFVAPGTEVEALGFLACIPLTVSLFGFRPLARRVSAGLLPVILVVAVNLVFYYAPDFSMIRHLWTWSSSRFLLPSVAILTLVSLAWCRPGSGASVTYVLVLRIATFVNLLATALTGFSPHSIKGVSLVLGGAVALAAAASVVSGQRVRALSFTVIALAALLGLGALRTRVRNDLYAQDFALHRVPKYWVGAVPLVDDPKVPRRIAVTSGPLHNMDNWFASPFLGRSLQNELVYEPISADGIIRRFGPGEANAEIARTASFEAWLGRLHEHHVTGVMSFTPVSLELRWMEARPELFERQQGDGATWGLYRVK